MNKNWYLSEIQRYIVTCLVASIVFGLAYFYISSQQIPNALNKAVADTSVILIGLSMVISSICYFFNFLDFSIVYRKHLGLVGFAFGVVHFALSFSAFQRLFQFETWQKFSFWPALTGLIALIIFSIMAAISNQFAARLLGGKLWKGILRTGYIAMFFVLLHVIFLKWSRWQTWYSEGMTSLPAMSLIATSLIIMFILVRIMLSVSLKRNKLK